MFHMPKNEILWHTDISGTILVQKLPLQPIMLGLGLGLKTFSWASKALTLDKPPKAALALPSKTLALYLVALLPSLNVVQQRTSKLHKN